MDYILGAAGGLQNLSFRRQRATGNPQDLREVAALARSGKLKTIPVTVMPKDQANAALRLLHDGGVNGRVVLAS